MEEATQAAVAVAVQALLVVTRAQVLLARVEAVQPRLMELPTQVVVVVVGLPVLAAAEQAAAVLGHIVQHQATEVQIQAVAVVEVNNKVVELAVQVL